MKHTESEPTVFGMGLIPLSISGIATLVAVVAIVTVRSLIGAVVIGMILLLIIFVANYIYNSRIFDRLSDKEHPKNIHNDIY